MREDESQHSISGCYLISYLLIEMLNTVGKPRWLSFCEYKLDT